MNKLNLLRKSRFAEIAATMPFGFISVYSLTMPGCIVLNAGSFIIRIIDRTGKELKMGRH
jgi:hypothetical protein